MTIWGPSSTPGAPNAATVTTTVFGSAYVGGASVAIGAAAVSGSAHVGGTAVAFGAAAVSVSVYLGGRAVAFGAAKVTARVSTMCVTTSAVVSGFFFAVPIACITGRARL